MPKEVRNSSSKTKGKICIHWKVSSEDYQKVKPRWEPKNVYTSGMQSPCSHLYKFFEHCVATQIGFRRDCLSDFLKLLNSSWHCFFFFFLSLIPFCLTGGQKSATPLLCYAWNHLLLLWMFVLLNTLVSQTNDSNFHLISSCKHCQSLSAYCLSLIPLLTLLNCISVF